MSLRKTALAILLAAATVAVYGRAMSGPFQFDDEAGILQNPSIQNLSDIKSVLTYKPELPRPLFNLSLAVDYRLHGLKSTGYHVTNLVIHLLGVFGVWWLAWEIYRALGLSGLRRGPAIAAFIFALHPLATEPTIYIWSRSSSMMAAFSVYSVALYLSAWRKKRATPRIFLSWTAFVMAMLSKEEAAALPAILLLVDWVVMPPENRRKRLLWQGVYWLIPLSAAVYRLAAGVGMYDLISWRGAYVDEYAEMVIKHGVSGMALINAVTQLKVGLNYALMLLWPASQSVDHGVVFETGFPGVAAFAGMGFTALLIGLFFLCRRNRPLVSVFSVFFLLPLAVFYVIPVSDAMVERRLCLPLAGWAILLGGALSALATPNGPSNPSKLSSAGKMKWAKRGLPLLLLILLGALTYKRTMVWSDRVALWNDAVRVSPDKLRPRVILARYHYEKGDYYRAIHENLAAIRIKENYGPPIVNLGLIYLNLGDFGTAEHYFRDAVRWRPESDFTAHFNLAVALERKGELEEAAAEYRKTIAINHGDALAAMGLGRLLAMKGDLDEAVKYFRRALDINPDLARARLSLGLAYLQRGRLLEAEQTFAQYADNPDFTEALFGLAQVRLTQGRKSEALALLRRFVHKTDLNRRPELKPLVQQARHLLAAAQDIHR